MLTVWTVVFAWYNCNYVLLHCIVLLFFSSIEQGQEFTAVTEDADKRLKSMWFRQKTWGLFG